MQSNARPKNSQIFPHSWKRPRVAAALTTFLAPQKEKKTEEMEMTERRWGGWGRWG